MNSAEKFRSDNWTTNLPLVVLFASLAAANLFGDFAIRGNVFWFVPLLLVAAGAHFLAADRATPENFWWVSICLRLLVLPMAVGDDVWRYIWEGQIQWRGFDPYVDAPDVAVLTHLRNAVWTQMNHHEFAAVYPPGAEILFKWLAIGGGSVLLLKLVFLLSDLGTIWVVLKIHPVYRDVAWYAWCPLVVYSFAGAAHYDCLMLLTTLQAVYFLVRACGDRSSWIWPVLACLFLGAAISIKVVPMIFIPVFAIALGRRCVALVFAIFIPFLTSLPYGFPPRQFVANFMEFGKVARFNDTLWWISEHFFWANPTHKNGLYSLLGSVAVASFSIAFWQDWRRGLLWTMGAALMVSTVLHPWYLTWILPFAAIFRAHVWFVWAGTVFLALLWWESTSLWQAWQPSMLLSLAMILPPLGWLSIQKWRKAI